MPNSSLSDLLQSRRKYILAEINHRVDVSPLANHQESIMQSADGQKRLLQWIDLLIQSIDTGPDALFEFQHKIGYYRSLEGFKLEKGANYYILFQQIVWELFQSVLSQSETTKPALLDELQCLTMNCLHGCVAAGISHLTTHRETISQTISYLESLYKYASGLIQLFEPAEIAGLLIKRITGLLGAGQGFLILCRGKRIDGIYRHPPSVCPPQYIKILKNCWQNRHPLFLSSDGTPHDNVDRHPIKQLVCVPLSSSKHITGAILLCDESKGFSFTTKELNVLNQFCYITEITLENSYYLKKIEHQRQDLSLLTGKIISIQENERKELANDIHDTIAQSLTGIGYRLEALKSSTKGDPEPPSEDIEKIISMINTAIDQARGLITSLRPQLLDTIGFIPALENWLQQFMSENGMTIHHRLSPDIFLSAETGICLFRVVQEGLTNIFKHADVNSAELTLQRDPTRIRLVISDKGRGLIIQDVIPSIENNRRKFGLMMMRERLKSIGGSLKIDSTPGRGVRLEAVVPCQEATING